MGRPLRLKVVGEIAYYHIMSRTVGQQLLFGDVEKEKLFNIIKYYSGFYFVKVIGITIMSNHFHLLIKSEPESMYSDDDVKERVEKYSNQKDQKNKIQLKTGFTFDMRKKRKEMENISEFARALKQTFSRWYNKENKRTGYLWSDRFKSVLIEKEEGLINCLAYIDLNPVRAGMVDRPEDYRWSGIGYRIYTDNKEDFLSFDGIFSGSDVKDTPKEKLIEIYRWFVYKCGNIKRLTLADLEEGKEPDDIKSAIDDETYMHELMKGFEVPKGDIMLGRIRYFSEGLVIGSREFLQGIYSRFGGSVIGKKDRKIYRIGISKNIFSLRNLLRIR